MKFCAVRGAVVGVFIGIAGPALSADMPVKAPVVAPINTLTGFYTVVGGSVLLPGRADVKDRDCASAASLIPCGVDNSMKGDVGWMLGGAVGYRFSPWFRADVSIGYGELIASGTRPPAPTEAFSPSYHAKVTSLGGFVTGYIDLAGLVTPGYFGRFEPFVGAGVGAVNARVRDLYFSNTGNPGVQFNLPTLDTTKAAFKVTVGTGYRLTQHWSLVAAYTYYDLGRLETPAGTVTTTPAGAIPPFQTNGFDFRARSHAAELGVRYDF